MVNKKIIVKIRNIISISLLISLFFNIFSYAEVSNNQMTSVFSVLNNIDGTIINTGNLDIEEEPRHNLLSDGWIGFYKNFIFELGGVKLSYYDGTGNLVAQRNILPNQFKEDTSREFAKETVYEKEGGTLILRDTVNKYFIDASGFSFSDNIPCFIKNVDNYSSVWEDDFYNNNKEPYVRVDFSKWEGCKNISEWLNDIANLQTLTDELGVSFEGSNDLTVWIGSTTQDCKSPGVLIEPITFYPDSTEEIYCNDKKICDDYNLTHGLTSKRLEAEMKEIGEWHWYSGFLEAVGSLTGWSDLDIFVHIGILKYDLSGGTNTFDFGTINSTEDKDAGTVVGDNFKTYYGFFDRQFVYLTYTETTKYSKEWQKQQGLPVYSVERETKEEEYETIDYTKKYSAGTFVDLTEPIKESKSKYGSLINDPNITEYDIEFYKNVGLINDNEEVLTYAEYEEFYDTNEDNIKTYVNKITTEKPDQIVTANAFWWNFRKTRKEDQNSKVEYTYEEAKEIYTSYLRTSIAGKTAEITEEGVINYWVYQQGYTYDESTKIFTRDFSIKRTYTYDEAEELYILVNIEEEYRGDYFEIQKQRERLKEALTKNILDDFMLTWGSGYDWISEQNLYMIEEGIGGTCYIKTDHNAFTCLVLKTSDTCLAVAEENLAGVGALNSLVNDRVYKFGAALIIGPPKVATGSQILIKFHSNLEQLGGSGSIDEQYNLIGTEGSSEYTWQKTI